MKVLVVSEDPDERSRAASALELTSVVDVRQVGTAAEARALLQEDHERFDVLIVDGDLRPRGGFALLYDLRARAEMEQTPPIPSIVLAAREQDRWLADWSGSSAVVLKPVDPFRLSQLVQQVALDEVPAYGDAGSASQQVAAALRGER